MPSEPETPRRRLLALYAAGLAAARGDAAVRRALAGNAEPAAILAVGKAAASMARGAREVLGEGAMPMLVVTRHGHGDEVPVGAELIEGGHPLPDADSLRAGRRVREWLAALTSSRLLVLLSGGSSALLECLPEGVGLEALRALNAWLLASGLPIGEMNRIRAALSCCKAGRLLQVVPAGVRVEVLLVSDVPGDRPWLIGSGPFHPWPEPPVVLPEELPGSLASGWQGCPPAAGPAPPHHVVASGAHALAAVEAEARRQGLAVHRHAFLEGEAEAQGRRIGCWLREAAPPGLHLWHGETTVRLPPDPGRGGRNQHLALAAAVELARTRGLWLLAAATDGSDGNTEDAGGLVDGGTLARGRMQGLDPEQALARADSGAFLAASGDLVSTGPTGTNVMDLVLALKANA